MRTWYHIVLTLLIVPFMISGTTAQHRWMGGGPEPPRFDRLERFRMMRLIELLKLDEETSVRLAAKFTAHQDREHALMAERNGFLDAIDSLARTQNEGNLQKVCDRVMENDRKLFDERQRFHNDVRGILTPLQFGKYLVFERNFGRQVREAIEDLHKDHRPGPGQE